MAPADRTPVAHSRPPLARTSGMGEATHPFLAAWEARDADAWAAALATEVVVHSPLIGSPFSGREAVAELYGVLFELFGAIEFLEHLVGGDTHAFLWRGAIGDRTVEGADFVHTNAAGEVDEIRVLMRPLTSLGTFTRAVGPALARREGRARGALVVLTTRPVRGLFAAIDAVATRLGQR